MTKILNLQVVDQFCKKNNLNLLLVFSAFALFFPGPGDYLNSIEFFNLRSIGGTFSFNFIALMIFILMLSSAARISIAEMKNLVKEKKTFVIASLHIYIVAPFIAYLMSALLRFICPVDLAQNISVGLALLSAAPLTITASYWIALADGNVAFAAAMATLSASLAPILMPFVLQILTDVSISRVQIPFWPAVQFLLFTTWLPFALVLSVRHFQPALIEKLRFSLSFLGTLSVIGVNYVVVAKSAPIILGKLTILSFSGIFLIVMLYVSLNFVFGFFIAGACRLNRKDQVSLTFLGAMRNNPLPAAIASAAYSQQFPLAIVPPTLSVFHHIIAKAACWCLNRRTRLDQTNAS